MAETQATMAVDAPAPAASPAPPAAPKPSAAPRLALSKVYELPLPIRTHPLPIFIPHNPLSWLHIAWVLFRHAIFPPANEPSVIHIGIWDPATGSVHVTDDKSIRALWEQGFFGKGSLSRSEPNWVKREEARRGLGQVKVAETFTVERREERKRAKWERARAEQEAIRQVRLQEMLEDEEAKRAQHTAAESSVSDVKSEVSDHVPVPQPDVAPQIETCTVVASTEVAKPAAPAEPVKVRTLAHATYVFSAAPVGPLELLALPNSMADLTKSRIAGSGQVCPTTSSSDGDASADGDSGWQGRPPVGPLELLALPNSASDIPRPRRGGCITPPPQADNQAGSEAVLLSSSTPSTRASANGSEAHETALTDASPTEHELHGIRKSAPGTPASQKSVRFSALVESTTFARTDPPSPSRSPIILTTLPDIDGEAAIVQLPEAIVSERQLSRGARPARGPIVSKEHLQLMPEEAFFLILGLGALSVLDPATRQEIPAPSLLTLFRQHSKYPPCPPSSLSPDDGFLVNYAAYHHYRSLGWVPRAGIKFGVDWLLYARGPPFDHAEFGIIIVPSFSHAWWKTHGAGQLSPQKSWAWLHGILRVLTRAVKTFVLAYVDVPPPPVFDEALATGGATAAMGLYRIREVVVKRWQANRNRQLK